MAFSACFRIMFYLRALVPFLHSSALTWTHNTGSAQQNRIKDNRVRLLGHLCLSLLADRESFPHAKRQPWYACLP